jgi:class 3 adenylate cyclase
MTTPHTRWARTIDGASIAYHDFGDGDLTLVDIRGWISHLEVYWEQPRFARFSRRLAQNMRVLQFDKRGVGMSDRFSSPPELEARTDDVRAVLDAANVERAALLGWGTGGPALAAFFAAAHPDRTVAVCMDSWILDRKAPGYPWGLDEIEHDRTLATLVETWGDPNRIDEHVRWAYGDSPRDGPAGDPEFLAWVAKSARYSATPTGYAAFDRMWYQTDVRDVLPLVRVPVGVLYKTEADFWGSRAQAEYAAARIPGAQLIAVRGSAPVLWVEDPEPLVSAVEAFLVAAQEQAAQLDRQLTTVLFTDIVQSTDTAFRVGDRAWKDMLERHHAVIRSLLASHRGTEVNTTGDGFVARFDGPARAIRCALAMVDRVQPEGLQIRAGLHTGEVENIDGAVGGIALNIGARVAAEAGPSEVVVSQTVKDLVVGSGLQFEGRGRHALKGVPGEWNLYAALRPRGNERA